MTSSNKRASANQRYEAIDRQDSDAPDMKTLEDDSDEQEDSLRNSADERRHDHETISAEEEAERLLTGEEKSGLRRNPGGMKSSRQRQSKKTGRWTREGGSESELMYKVEEGARSSSTGSSSNSSESDLHMLKEARTKTKTQKLGWGRVFALAGIVGGAFVGLLFGALTASQSTTQNLQPPAPGIAKKLSNGTHTFGPTTILISLDGFRADFLNRGLTPVLRSFIQEGVSPKYMLPSFPSLTFPNHFTIVTGKYPESHGIVGNTFWDPQLQREFHYTDPARSMTPEWWNAEPLWETAELHGVRSAIHMWPGSEAHIGSVEPAYVSKFNDKEPLDLKVRQVFDWLDLPGPNDTDSSAETPRPQFIAAYVPNVDADGHLYGPNSTYIRSTIAEVDGMLGSLFEGIHQRNLTDIVNIIVVSDHGMATTSNDRLLQFDDLVDPTLIEHIDGWPLYGLRPFDQSEEHLHEIYRSVYDKSRSAQYNGTFEVYLRDQTMPERYFFNKNSRIAPLWLVPNAGWAIVTKKEFDISQANAQGQIYHPRGLHGYDHEHPLMRAIFVARGPAFPHPKGSQVNVFQNTEVYNIICDSLGITPVPNNGTLRLPLKPTGVHDVAAPLELLHDPDNFDPKEDLSVQLLPPTFPNSFDEPFPPVESEQPSGDDKVSSVQPSGDNKASSDDNSEEKSASNSFLDWLRAKLDGLKHWGDHLFRGGKEDAADKNEKARRRNDF